MIVKVISEIGGGGECPKTEVAGCVGGGHGEELD
jgi:hypothetical protein